MTSDWGCQNIPTATIQVQKGKGRWKSELRAHHNLPKRLDICPVFPITPGLSSSNPMLTTQLVRWEISSQSSFLFSQFSTTELGSSPGLFQKTAVNALNIYMCSCTNAHRLSLGHYPKATHHKLPTTCSRDVLYHLQWQEPHTPLQAGLLSGFNTVLSHSFWTRTWVFRTTLGHEGTSTLP